MTEQELIEMKRNYKYFMIFFSLITAYGILWLITFIYCLIYL